MPTPNINQILKRSPVKCTWGAPLGQSDFNNSRSPLYLQRINFQDGDYAADGTYWGSGSSALWCAFNGEDADYAAAQGTRIYVRASTRAGAKLEVCKQFRNVTFKS